MRHTEDSRAEATKHHQSSALGAVYPYGIIVPQDWGTVRCPTVDIESAKFKTVESGISEPIHSSEWVGSLLSLIFGSDESRQKLLYMHI